MNHFDLLEAKVILKGEEVLSIKGQLKRHMIEPRFHLLITDVKHKEGIAPPYKRLDTSSLSGFTNKLYDFRFSLGEPLTYPDAQIKINTKRVEAIVD